MRSVHRTVGRHVGPHRSVRQRTNRMTQIGELPLNENSQAIMHSIRETQSRAIADRWEPANSQPR